METVERMLASMEEVVTDEKDESTDGSDVAHLCLYVRVFHDDCLQEDLLGLIPLEGHMTGEVIFNEIVFR